MICTTVFCIHHYVILSCNDLFKYQRQHLFCNYRFTIAAKRSTFLPEQDVEEGFKEAVFKYNDSTKRKLQKVLS